MVATSMPGAASAGARSRFQSFPWRAVSSDTRSRIASSAWPAPSPSAERTGTSASSSSSRPATRTMKNSSRPCEKIAANFSRSSSGRRSSSASSRTRAPNSTQESSRLRRRDGAGSVAVAMSDRTWVRSPATSEPSSSTTRAWNHAISFSDSGSRVPASRPPLATPRCTFSTSTRSSAPTWSSSSR